MQAKQCCWGILGAAEIARKNWQAIQLSGNGFLKAVASRSKDRAASFIADCEKSAPFHQPVEAIEGYENLLADPDIQAVYLPLPTALRDHWTHAAIDAGKHVLIEKPCSLNASILSEILDAAKTKNLQVMDGVMYAHSQRFQQLMTTIHQQKSIGDLHRISSQFSFFTDQDWAKSNIRGNANLEPFGALGDLGWYCIRISLDAMNGQMPIQVSARALQTYQHENADDPVPIELEGTLIFDHNVSAGFYCSFVTQLQQRIAISGSEGLISMDDFVLPFHRRKPQFEIIRSELVTHSCDFNMHRNGELHQFDETANSSSNAQESQLFRQFNTLVLEGKTDLKWPSISLNTQRVLDGLMQSIRQGGTTIDL